MKKNQEEKNRKQKCLDILDKFNRGILSPKTTYEKILRVLLGRSKIGRPSNVSVAISKGELKHFITLT